jgi:gluconolactonase
MSDFSLSRRSLLRSAAAITAGGSLLPKALAERPRDWSGRNPSRYPDADIIALDKRFKKYMIGNTPIKRHYTGLLWAEGPAWNGAGNFLVWSDIPNNRQMRYIPDDDHVSVFRNPSGYSNGNCFDYDGRQISFEHGARRVVRYEHSGKMTVLADKFDGKGFNAPNDGACMPDGSLWFTDPGYGALMNYEGFKEPGDSLQPIQKEAVYRIGADGKITKVTDEPFKPNGLCFSPDFKKCYIAETGASHYEKAPKNIWVFDVIDGTKLGKMKEFCSMEMEIGGQKKAGFADGIRCDVDGNVWVGSGWVGDGYDGVQVFAPDGVRIGQILLPEICANICFGGPKRNRLFMAASQSLYSVYVETQGAEVLVPAR